MTQKIAIFRGEGTWYQGVVPGLALSAQDLIHSDWESHATLLIMPGGRDRLFHAALQGKGNAKIRSFVEKGGIYLGLCAGAYYACSSIEFDKGNPLEVCENRELQFFPGTAIGPAYGKGTFQYDTPSTIRAAKLTTPIGTFHAYHNGGCTFSGDLSLCRILARYLDIEGHPPAIIECSIGQGKAILSGAHLEMGAVSSTQDSPLYELFLQSEPLRSLFWEKFIF